jgi:hypothetical protein
MDPQAQQVIQEAWTNESIMDVEINIIERMIGSRSVAAVEAAISYARFMRMSGLNNDNYALFLRFLEVENHWVIDAVIGNKDPFLVLSSIHPNNFLILNAYRLLTNWHPGGIYPKTLAIILGVLQASFASPKDGYRIYNVSVNDVNNLGKHLNKELGQEDDNNRTILDILDRLGSLAGTSDKEAIEQMARQANAIRTFFFDKRKKMEDIIPQVLLVKSDYIAKEIAPERVFIY